MATGQVRDGEFWAQCRKCGQWQAVAAAPRQADLYFEYWQAVFTCCQETQQAWFTIEKVDDDVH